jgi:para-aminobenzoate synthetase component 2
MHILLIDNNDSFTRNLEHLLTTAMAEVCVRVKPYVQLRSLDLTAVDLIVISPGPGNPSDYPGYERVIESAIPVLGVCLGMQIINAIGGGQTGRLPGCIHGKTDTITWFGRREIVARYHSLCVMQISDDLDVLARNDAGIIMGLGNAKRRLFGCQFHPESFLTVNGQGIIHDAFAFLGLV